MFNSVSAVKSIRPPILITSILLMIFLLPFFANAADDFPLRAKFSDSAYMSTADLHADFSNSLIFDVRSNFEYDVIHIKGAINAPIARAAFINQVQKAMEDNPGKKIVFYCNGHTCSKSYKAEVKARKAGIKGYAYDSGIFEWTEAHPEMAVLLGQNPAKPAKLISKDQLNARKLDVAAFQKGAAGAGAFLVDVRDPIQRKKTPPWAEKASKMSMDVLVKNLKNDIFRKKIAGKTLYIFDAVGKQVRWLQYRLEDEGVPNYYFLDKGMWSVYGDEGANG